MLACAHQYCISCCLTIAMVSRAHECDIFICHHGACTFSLQLFIRAPKHPPKWGCTGLVINSGARHVSQRTPSSPPPIWKLCIYERQYFHYAQEEVHFEPWIHLFGRRLSCCRQENKWFSKQQNMYETHRFQVEGVGRSKTRAWLFLYRSQHVKFLFSDYGHTLNTKKKFVFFLFLIPWQNV